MKPTFIGIGAQKCASTWLYQVIEDHPQAQVSKPKELNFFSHNYDHGFQWYEKHFRNWARRAIGEISPSYFHDTSAPERAYRYNAGFRIVVTLRDPIARAYSNHLHEIRIGQYTGPDLSFEAGMANNPMYVEQSLYAKHLQCWLDCFPWQQVLVLLQEEIQANPAAQAQRLYEFLKIDVSHQSAVLFRRANESYEEKVKGVNQALRRLGKLGRRLGMRGVVEAAKRNDSVIGFRNANRRHLRQVVPPMAADVRHKLVELFAQDTQELARMMGRADLPWTTFSDAQRDEVRSKLVKVR